MKLSIMMVAYNSEAYIAQAIQSILSQSNGLDIELIVIDDGSTDHTGDMLDELAAHHRNIRVKHTKNQGVTRARNEALRALAPDTDLVSFLDSDDLVPQGRYARDIALFNQQPELQIVFGNTILFREPAQDQSGPAAGSQTYMVRGIQLAAGTYRYKLIQQVGEFDTSFVQAEDMDFMLRMFEHSPRYHIIPEPRLFYRRHERNMTAETGQLRRDFSRALMMSIKRRKAGSMASYPADLFDAQDMFKAVQW